MPWLEMIGDVLVWYSKGDVILTLGHHGPTVWHMHLDESSMKPYVQTDNLIKINNFRVKTFAKWIGMQGKNVSLFSSCNH